MRCLQTRNYIVFSIFSRDFKARAEIAYGSGNPGHVEESGGLGFHVLFPLQRCPADAFQEPAQRGCSHRQASASSDRASELRSSLVGDHSSGPWWNKFGLSPMRKEKSEEAQGQIQMASEPSFCRAA